MRRNFHLVHGILAAPGIGEQKDACPIPFLGHIIFSVVHLRSKTGGCLLASIAVGRRDGLLYFLDALVKNYYMGPKY